MEKEKLEELANDYANAHFDHVTYTTGKQSTIKSVTDFNKLKAAFLAGFNSKIE